MGNKCDLDSKREEAKEEREQKAKGLRVDFIEISAMNRINIEVTFDKLINEVYKKCHQEFNSFSDVNVEVDVEEVVRRKTLSKKINNANTQKKVLP